MRGHCNLELPQNTLTTNLFIDYLVDREKLRQIDALTRVACFYDAISS